MEIIKATFLTIRSAFRGIKQIIAIQTPKYSINNNIAGKLFINLLFGKRFFNHCLTTSSVNSNK